MHYVVFSLMWMHDSWRFLWTMIIVRLTAKPAARETNIDDVFVPVAVATSTPARPVTG